jgi:hypothetical protein
MTSRLTTPKTLDAGQMRQGDVLIAAATQAIAGEAEPRDTDGSTVLAFGENTGHKHRFMDDGTIVQTRSSRQLTLTRASTLLHEEHTFIEIPSGQYDLPRQVEWTDDLEPRQVAD